MHVNDETPALAFDRESVRAVDRAAMERYGLPGIVLMENAARGAVQVAGDVLGLQDGCVVIICGSGNNGGDGYAMARHLHNAGLEVRLRSLGEPRAGTDADMNLHVCERMGLDIRPFDMAEDATGARLIVDAIFGTGLVRPVEGRAADAIDRINETDAPVLAVDLPSGLDCDSGEPLGTAVRAQVTATFVGWKRGFLRPAARAYTGEVRVVSIGVPCELLREFGEPMSPLRDS